MARPQQGRDGRVDAIEHEARGLLNLIGFVDRCLQSSLLSAGDHARWCRDRNQAIERLEVLYRAGLSPDFLSMPCKVPPHAIRHNAKTLAEAAD